jgi:hypothetical protein
MASLAAARMLFVHRGENPRSSASLIDRGLAAESARDFATAPHQLTSFARIEGTAVRYPADTLDLFADH